VLFRSVSDLPIPEWAVFEPPEPFDAADVFIRLDNLRISQPLEPESWDLAIPEAGTYRISRGREIIITPAPDAGAQELRLFLLGSAWGALCYQRGILALHMSVVQMDEHAVAFCGASGAGKSSIAAKLVARGYRLMGDDLCCFDFDTGVPRVYPSAPRLKLWRDALTHLDRQDDDLARDHFRLDKFHVTDLPGFQGHGTPVPLQVIYLLEWGDLGLTRVTGLNALRRLIASATYRAEWIASMGRTATYWGQCAQLARGTSIWELKRPRDWAMMDAAIKLLMEHLQSGLLRATIRSGM
jgi:hypothetical protein